MNTLQLRNSFLLLLTAVIWGVAFVAQSVGMDYVGPYTFTCVRSFIGGLFLIPCIALLNRLNPVFPGGVHYGLLYHHRPAPRAVLQKTVRPVRLARRGAGHRRPLFSLHY